MAKSATDLAAEIGEQIEQIQRATISETRAYVAKAIEDQFLKPTGRKTYGGASPDQCITDMLRDAPLNEIPQLRQALQRIEDNGGEVSEDMRAGILLVVRLFADEDFDY